jgi:chromate transporter
VAIPEAAVGLRELFVLFLRLGFSFGAGTGISAVLQEELVRKRQEVTRADFMIMYRLARLVSSGSMSTLAVAVGYRYQGLLGTVVVLVAMIAPGFLLTIALTVAYTLLAGSPTFPSGESDSGARRTGRRRGVNPQAWPGVLHAIR